MNDLLAKKRISSFGPILAAYAKAGIPLRDAIDGGAGFGSSAKEMLRHITGRVYAFKPFPGNHRFFEGIDPRVTLIPKALADRTGAAALRVPSVVSAESDWGKRGLAGYSSAGHIVATKKENDLAIECVRADEVVGSVDFVKLDLQGGELNALKGMSFLRSVTLMWIEYIGQPGLVGYLESQGFTLFDTEFFFSGAPSDKALELFSVSREGVKLSSGAVKWSGFKKAPWGDFEPEFKQYRKEFGLSWTDLACVSESRMSEFQRAMQGL